MKNLKLRIDPELEQYLISETPVHSLFNIGGVRLRFAFPNKWQASVIKFWGSYGYEEDLWELAVLDKNDNLRYDNPICEGWDVRGSLSDSEVNDMLHQIFEWEEDQKWPEYEEED